MTTVQDVLNALERIAPSRFAFAFDKVGLQVGDRARPVSRAVVSLDRSRAAIEFAKNNKADLLVSHHPLIWDPLTSVTSNGYAEGSVAELIRNDIAFIAAHTNWDCAAGGISDTLAGLVDLKKVRSFGSAQQVPMLKVTTFAPLEAAERILDAASEAGAGVIGLYERCAFKLKGSGTYVGGEETNPVIGQAGKREEVEEIRIEMVAPAYLRVKIEAAIKAAHPYEEPAIDFYQLQGVNEQPLCRVGELPSPLSLSAFAALVDEKLGTRCWTFGDPARVVAKVAVCGGAGDDEWVNAKSAGADVFVTGEVRQHKGLEASESGFALIAAGHYATEHPGCVALAERLSAEVSDVEWMVFEPERGRSGRPF